MFAISSIYTSLSKAKSEIDQLSEEIEELALQTNTNTTNPNIASSDKLVGSYKGLENAVDQALFYLKQISNSL